MQRNLIFQIFLKIFLKILESNFLAVYLPVCYNIVLGTTQPRQQLKKPEQYNNIEQQIKRLKMAEKFNEDYYLDLFNEHIKGGDINIIAVEVECSTTTVYNYLSGKSINIHTAKAIKNKCIDLLKEKGINTETVA